MILCTDPGRMKMKEIDLQSHILVLFRKIYLFIQNKIFEMCVTCNTKLTFKQQYYKTDLFETMLLLVEILNVIEIY